MSRACFFWTPWCRQIGPPSVAPIDADPSSATVLSSIRFLPFETPTSRGAGRPIGARVGLERRPGSRERERVSTLG
eukprot:6224656-Pyramimonas_sp.AAC.1